MLGGSWQHLPVPVSRYQSGWKNLWWLLLTHWGRCFYTTLGQKTKGCLGRGLRAWSLRRVPSPQERPIMNFIIVNKVKLQEGGEFFLLCFRAAWEPHIVIVTFLKLGFSVQKCSVTPKFERCVMLIFWNSIWAVYLMENSMACSQKCPQDYTH